MKTINVQISEVEYNTFGFSKDNIPFSEFTDIIERQIARQALRSSVSLAETQGLSADELLVAHVNEVYKDEESSISPSLMLAQTEVIGSEDW